MPTSSATKIIIILPPFYIYGGFGCGYAANVDKCHLNKQIYPLRARKQKNKSPLKKKKLNEMGDFFICKKTPKIIK
jgi:hypothetical protein